MGCGGWGGEALLVATCMLGNAGFPVELPSLERHCMYTWKNEQRRTSLQELLLTYADVEDVLEIILCNSDVTARLSESILSLSHRTVDDTGLMSSRHLVSTRTRRSRTVAYIFHSEMLVQRSPS